MGSSKRRNTSTSLRFTRRTQVVWVSFITAMTLAMGGLLMFGERDQRSGFLATNLQVVSGTPQANDRAVTDPVLQIDAPLDRERWSGIVIHHLGKPAGDAASIHRFHQHHGLHGLGYHFLIGNGNGLGDGVVHVGYRWNEQLPGAHVSGSMGRAYNERTIGICLVGNGDRRLFTRRQLAQLLHLVRGLQRELGIPASDIQLRRDLQVGGQASNSPGEYFPAALFREQLLD